VIRHEALSRKQWNARAPARPASHEAERAKQRSLVHANIGWLSRELQKDLPEERRQQLAEQLEAQERHLATLRDSQ
jgi:hypothetical protein